MSTFARTAIALGAIVATACGGASTPPAATTPAHGDHAAHHGDHAAHHGDHAAHHGHTAGHVDHDFSDVDKWVAVFDDPARDSWQRPAEVVSLLGPGPGHIVVDIGAGTGYFERHLTRAVGGAGKVWALDTEPKLVEYLNGRAKRELWNNVEARVVAADDPALPQAGVDRILIVDTWHHLPGRAAYAGKLAAALRPGGAIAIVDFTVDAPMGPPPAMRLPAETVAAELRAVGLTATIATEQLPHQYVVIATKAGR